MHSCPLVLCDKMPVAYLTEFLDIMAGVIVVVLFLKTVLCISVENPLWMKVSVFACFFSLVV